MRKTELLLFLHYSAWRLMASKQFHSMEY